MSQGDSYEKLDESKVHAGKTDLGKLILTRMLKHKQDVSSGKKVNPNSFFSKKVQKPKVVQQSESKYAKSDEAKQSEKEAKHVLARGSLVVPDGAKVTKIQNPGLQAKLMKPITISQKDPTTGDGGKSTPVPKDSMVVIHNTGNKDVCFVELFKLDDHEKAQKKGEGYALRKNIKTTQKFVPTDEPLFPEEPNLNDLKQGSIGDCYLIAGLGSIVKRDPNVIKRAILDNGDGTVTVRLFDKKKDDPNEFEEKFITFEKSVLKSEEGNHAKDTLWVQMLEKAYAIHCKETTKEGDTDAPKTDDGPTTGSYVKMGAGGHSSDIFEAFLGRPCRSEGVKRSGNLGEVLKGMRDTVPNAKTVTTEDVAKIKAALVKKGLSEATAKKIAETFEGKGGDDMLKDVEKAEMPNLYPLIKDELKDAELTPDDVMIAIRNNATKDPSFAAISEFTDNVDNLSGKCQEDIDELMKSDKFKALPNDMQKKFREETAGQFPGKLGTGVYSKQQEALYAKIVDTLTVEGCISMGTTSDVGKIAGKGFSGGEPVSETGMVGDHAYSITGIHEPKEGDPLFLPGAKNQVKYVRVRNPWGDGEENKNVKKSDKHGMQYLVVTDPKNGDFVTLVASPTHEGEFFMELNDITKYCQNIYTTDPIVSDEKKLRQKVDELTKGKDVDVEEIAKEAESVLYEKGMESAVKDVSDKVALKDQINELVKDTKLDKFLVGVLEKQARQELTKSGLEGAQKWVKQFIDDFKSM